MTLEKRNYQENKSLRSPLYIYNLLRRLGDKHCALCGCEIPEIIQGRACLAGFQDQKGSRLTPEQRLEYALDGENGLWLCENHHKLFDENLLSFDRMEVFGCGKDWMRGMPTISRRSPRSRASRNPC